MKILEHIAFGPHNPEPKLRGYKCEHVRIVQHQRYNSETSEHEDAEIVIQIQCPCCNGRGEIEGTLYCNGRQGGCEHEVTTECNTCNSQGWCDLRFVRGDDTEDGSETEYNSFMFDGWEENDVVEMPDWLAEKFYDHAGIPAKMRYIDPNQLGLFASQEDSKP